MITPIFSIIQDDEFLIFTIKAPYAKIAETEIEYAENFFLFCSKPYYLRVNLPKEVLYDEERSSAKYNADDGTFIVHVPKLNKGETFDGLDMITELLRPQRAAPTAAPLVEELSGSESDVEDEEYYADDNEGDEFLVEQNPTEVKETCSEGTGFGYGFAWKRGGVLGQLSKEIGNLVEVPNVEESLVVERAHQCRAVAMENFSQEHYLCDNLTPDEELQRILRLDFPSEMQLTEADRERLKDLPNRKLPKLSPAEEHAVALSLVDIVYAYCYDIRTNDFDHSVESGWNIVHLAPSLCWLVKWQNAREAVQGVVARVLTQPLYRNWELALKVLEDTRKLFNMGRAAIVHAICECHSLMVGGSEFRYLFNDLILTDLLLWIQSVGDGVINKLTAELAEVQLLKSDLSEFQLDDLEMEGRMQMMQLSDEKARDSDENGYDSDDEPETTD